MAVFVTHSRYYSLNGDSGNDGKMQSPRPARQEKFTTDNLSLQHGCKSVVSAPTKDSKAVAFQKACT